MKRSYWSAFLSCALQVQYLSFDAQIDAYEKVNEGVKAKIGDAAAKKLSNEALFLIGLGIQTCFHLSVCQKNIDSTLKLNCISK